MAKIRGRLPVDTRREMGGYMRVGWFPEYEGWMARIKRVAKKRDG